MLSLGCGTRVFNLPCGIPDPQLWHMGSINSSLTRDQFPALGAQSLSHWITRKSHGVSAELNMGAHPNSLYRPTIGTTVPGKPRWRGGDDFQGNELWMFSWGGGGCSQTGGEKKEDLGVWGKGGVRALAQRWTGVEGPSSQGPLEHAQPQSPP